MALIANRFAPLAPEKTVDPHRRSCVCCDWYLEERFGKNVWSDVSMANNVTEQTVPAMIIHDEDDTDVPWQEGYAVSQAWPGCRFVKTRQLGHHRILRDTTTIRTVAGFILHQR
jgi:pimeloyl-ACP methyl ester carboxylesterase